MAVELVHIDLWLHSVLSANTTITTACAGRLYADLAPDSAALPAVVWQHQAPLPDSTTVDGNRALVQSLVLVRCIDQTTSWTGTIRTVADAIDTVLHQAAGAAVGAVTVGACHREQAWRLLDPAEGRQYRHLGGLYRVVAYATP